MTVRGILLGILPILMAILSAIRNLVVTNGFRGSVVHVGLPFVGELLLGGRSLPLGQRSDGASIDGVFEGILRDEREAVSRIERGLIWRKCNEYPLFGGGVVPYPCQNHQVRTL